MNRQSFGRTFRVANNGYFTRGMRNSGFGRDWVTEVRNLKRLKQSGRAPAEGKESLRQAAAKGACPGDVWASWIKSELRRHGIPAQDRSRPLCIRRCVAQNVGLELFHLFRSPVR